MIHFRSALALATFFFVCGLRPAAPETTSVTQAGITLKSVSVTLPQSDRDFPGGDSADVMVRNCTACHSPGMILTQPALSKAAWQDEVNKMRTAYKAPVAPEDVPAIVAYLSELKGGK
jgi:cytochrome c5